MVFKKGDSGNIAGSIRIQLLIVCFLFVSPFIQAQDAAAVNTNESFTLQECINYALVHQPGLNQALLNESITRANNAISLSGWYPQASVSGTFTHYDKLPTTFEENPVNPNGPPIVGQAGIPNSVTPQLAITQNLINPSLIYAAKTARLFNVQAKQMTDSTKIGLVSAVSKTFYSVLLTLEQIDVLKADTVELARSVSDAYHQYVGGIVDETDYEEATITLNNTMVQLRQAMENLVPQYATLKQLMGYPPEKQFNISFDTSQMISEITIDSTQQLQYEKRIELQQLYTAIKLQEHLIKYYHLQFLPSISGFFDYSYEFGSTYIADLFNNSYPYSSFGLSLNIPLFTGFSRVENVKKARLQEEQLKWSEVNLRSEIYTEYTTALANYKSNLYSFHIMQSNINMAKRVYFVVSLQYKQGVVPYLNVITAQSNLITSEIGYVNALFQALSSKIDLEKAMGDITY